MNNKVIFYNPNDAASFIELYEGYRSNAYKCSAGVYTIGIGHTKGVKQGDKITRQKAYELFSQDLINTHNDLINLVKVPINEKQFIALMSFVYNFGMTKCRTYSIFDDINRGDFITAARKFTDYRSPGSASEKGLTKRRLAEQRLFVSNMNLDP